MTADTLTRAPRTGLLVVADMSPILETWFEMEYLDDAELYALLTEFQEIRPVSEPIPSDAFPPFHATSPRLLFAPAHNQVFTLPSWIHDSRITSEGAISLVTNESGLFECELDDVFRRL